MKITKLNKVEKKEFNDIYNKSEFKKDKTWELLFKNTIQQIDNFSSSLSFWYVADFAKGVVKVGGDCDLATPLKKKDWINLQPWDIGAMFHPMDEAKMRAFIVFVAGYLATKKDAERHKIKISLVFRMLNANNQYTWRIMEYPAMHYQNNEPRFLLCHVSEINHLLHQPKCVMYIFDSNKKEPTMFYCDEENVQLKPLNPNKALSDREIEILKLLTKGLISKEIANVLHISKSTVENHKQNIYTKTGTKKINELISYGIKNILNEN